MKMNKKFVFYLEITTFCNMSCPFCPSSLTKNHSNMSFDNIINVINKIKENISLLYFHVLGEPLLHPNFKEVINYCEKEKIPFALTTNGVFLNNYKELLNKEYLQKINISLQSLIQFSKEEINNYLDNICEFINYRNSINSVHPINLRLWNDKNNPEIIFLNNYLHQYFDKIIENNLNIRFSESDEFKWPSTLNTQNKELSGCLGGKKQFAILHDGSICLCCLDNNGKTKLGNIFECEFHDILDSKLYKEVIESFNNRKPFFELCKNCTFRNRFK